MQAVPESRGCKFAEQKVRNSPGDLRPVLVVLDNTSSTAIIVDVTILLESSPSAFQVARQEKIRKYTPLADWLTREGYEVATHALIVGAWDPENIHALRVLVSRHYAQLMSKLCVNDAIRGSNNIWKQKSRSNLHPGNPPLKKPLSPPLLFLYLLYVTTSLPQPRLRGIWPATAAVTFSYCTYPAIAMKSILRR